MVFITHPTGFASVPFLPPPLHIHKKARKAAFRRRKSRRPTLYQPGESLAYGPLDDIIDEIESNIWLSPKAGDQDLSYLDWSQTLTTTTPSCAVAPLQISSLPSEETLKVRKHRRSRHSTSASNMGDHTFSLRGGSSENNCHADRVSLAQNATPWPALDFGAVDANTAKQRIDTGGQHRSTQSTTITQRRPSRLRVFTNGLARLRRTNTGDTNGSRASVSENTTPATAISDRSLEIEDSHDGPSEETIDAYLRKNAHDCHKLRQFMDRIARKLPTATEPEDCIAKHTLSVPPTIRASTSIYSQVKHLSGGLQEFLVAIEVEAVLHGRTVLLDSTVDVVLVIDNGYYVSSDCLDSAINAVSAAMYHLCQGDRIALYTTHCTHNAVTGNRPEQYYPLRSSGPDTENDLRALIADIGRNGTQVRQPARPNPSMADVVLSVARSLEKDIPRAGSTHMILLSPAAYVLHDVSNAFPDLFIHRVNPAVLPYRPQPEADNTVCFEDCCTNVFVSNWKSHQSVGGCIKRILKNARSKQPIGQISDVSIDVRLKDGCELVGSSGSKDISDLRLGQAHVILAHLRVDVAKVKAVDLKSVNPIFNSSLDVKGLRQELQNANTLGAVKVHLLDVQVYHRNSINAANCWSYSETPLILIRDLGGLAPPFDNTSEMYMRLYFQRFSCLNIQDAIAEAAEVLRQLSDAFMPAKAFVERMVRELRSHQASLQYELEHRQRLPLCPGPIATEVSHDWLKDIWSRRRITRKVMADARDTIADCMHGI